MNLRQHRARERPHPKPLRRTVNRGGSHARRRGDRPRDDPELERALLTERAKFTRAVDIELRVACSSESATRLELGTAARELLRLHAYRRLGFVRLSDYARERLGVSASTLRAAAWVAARLDALPLVAAAFERSELSWGQVRALCAIADPDHQEVCLARARDSTVDDLQKAAAARRARARTAGRADPDADDPDADDPDADDATIDGEPSMRWRIACPARVRALWRRAVELASRAAGEPLAAWRATEIIAAEALSGRPAGVSLVDRVVLAGLRLVRRERRARAAVLRASEAKRLEEPADGMMSLDPPDHDTENHGDAAVGGGPLGGLGTRDTSPVELVHRDTSRLELGTVDPFALDARLAAAVHAMRTVEPRIGRLLRIVVDQRVYRAHGFSSFAAYARERLGISARKAWALLKVERSTRRSTELTHAYESGALSWVRALTLLPVIDRETAPAWLARAHAVTVRRLADEVSWVLEQRDLHGPSASLDPPPGDSALPQLVAPPFAAPSHPAAWKAPHAAGAAAPLVQIGEHAAVEGAMTKCDVARRAMSEVCDVEIHVTAPAMVVALMRQALDAYAEPGAPRWLALERVLQHVITHWESLPRHHDPIFARDGWRCAVPGCTSRRSLHDHHLHYRSRGGGNERTNRVAVCASHHLHGIHTGYIRAHGSAPRDVRWELGVRSSAPPLLEYVGDRLCLATR